VVLRDDSFEAELASYLRIEERELEAGGVSLRTLRAGAEHNSTKPGRRPGFVVSAMVAA